MDFRLKDRLELNGFDVDKGVATFFDNDDLYIEALKKFVIEDAVNSLIKSVSMDLRLGLSQATRLIPYVNRLGLSRLYEALEELCISIRNGLTDSTIKKLSDVYNEVKEIIKSI